MLLVVSATIARSPPGLTTKPSGLLKRATEGEPSPEPPLLQEPASVVTWNCLSGGSVIWRRTWLPASTKNSFSPFG